MHRTIVNVQTGGVTQVELTPEEVAAAEAAVAAWVDPTAYKRQRAAEYPPMADYLDGVVKGDQAQMDAYVAACLAVKAKYPKENQIV